MKDNPSLSEEFHCVVKQIAYNTIYHNKLISKYDEF